MTALDSPPTSQEAQPPTSDVSMPDVGSATAPAGQEAPPPAPAAGTTGDGSAAPGTVPKAVFP
eukprot:921502-Lingulodinium_polyedra.AAC.1